MQVTINIDFQKIKEQYIEKAVQKFIEVGEECIKEARDNGSYQDQSGNLRNSVGYCVLLNGEVKGQKVSHLNKTTIDEVSQKYPKDLVLIVVAGMNYAVYVEVKGYNVLSSAELKAEKILKTVFRR